MNVGLGGSMAEGLVDEWMSLVVYLQGLDFERNGVV